MAFLDSDDLWMPDKLERQIKWMNDNGYAFSCTAYEQIDEDDNSLKRTIKTVKKTNYNRLLSRNAIYEPAARFIAVVLATAAPEFSANK